MNDLQAEIKAVIAEVLGVPEAKVTSDAYLIEDLGADSLDAVELSLLLEERYHSPIDDAVILALVTVEDLIDVVERLHAQGAEEV